MDIYMQCMRCGTKFNALELKNKYGVFCDPCFNKTRAESKLAYEMGIAEKKKRKARKSKR